eukprot:5558670-Pyramimonas_sp.AAC.1
MVVPRRTTHIVSDPAQETHYAPARRKFVRRVHTLPPESLRRRSAVLTYLLHRDGHDPMPVTSATWAIEGARFSSYYFDYYYDYH